MDRSKTKDADRIALHRLLKGLEIYRSWRIACLQRDRGQVTQEDLNEIVMPASFFLEMFDQTNGGGQAAVLREVRTWYSLTASDLQLAAQGADPAMRADVHAFMALFEEAMGGSFLTEAGYLKALADRAVQAGRIKTAQDYDALKELEDDPSQIVITAKTLADVSVLLRAFEAR